MTDDEFLAAFETCTLPPADWTHAAHVRLAWLRLTRAPFPAALDQVRAGIRRYNASVGSAGYHETITVAFVRLIHVGLSDGRESFAAFCRRRPDLLDRTLAALFDYYSRGTLFSDAARADFVEPDVMPLPDPLDPGGRPCASCSAAAGSARPNASRP
jgi:hypothetical protein